MKEMHGILVSLFKLPAKHMEHWGKIPAYDVQTQQGKKQFANNPQY